MVEDPSPLIEQREAKKGFESFELPAQIANFTVDELATWVWDIENNKIFADRALARMFSVSEEDAAGGPVQIYLSAIHPEDRQRVETLLQQALADGSRYEATYRVLCSQGIYRTVMARGRVEFGKGGIPVRMPGIVLDITKNV